MIEAMGRLYALSRLVTHCVIHDGYVFPSQLVSSIRLSPVGDRLRDVLVDAHADGDSNSATAAVFGLWAGTGGLYVDLESSDIKVLEKHLHEEVLQRRINYPWVFGRDLRDSYVDIVGPEPSTIDADVSMQIIRSCPQGVVQQREYVTGPFGVLKSASLRRMRIAGLGASLICADPSCPIVHTVALATGRTRAGEAYGAGARLSSIPRAIQRDSSRSLHEFEQYWSPRHMGDLPWLLGNGLTTEELRLLVAQLIEANSDNLRNRIHDLDISAKRKPPLAIVSDFAHAQLMQLTLSCSDRAIVPALEDLVLRGALPMGETETRSAIMGTRGSGYFETFAELGRLGVRFRSRGLSPSEHSLLVVEETFHGLERELAWQLRGVAGSDMREKLQQALMVDEPAKVLHKILFSSHEALARVIEILGPSDMGPPVSEEDEKQLLQRLLWKLGYRDASPPRVDALVKGRLAEFVNVSSVVDRDSETRMRLTRGAGNELFVALEDLFTSGLEFAAWALLSDHYGPDRHERFTFTRQSAHASAGRTLASVNDEGFTWSLKGRNSLGTVIEGFRRLADICEQHASARDQRLRPLDQLPEYAILSKSVPFPFRHISLIADLRAESADNLVSTMRATSQILSRGRLVDIRNRLSHNRPDEFPSPEEIESAARSLGEVLLGLDGVGLLPVVYTMSRNVNDRYGRSAVYFEDGEGCQLTINNPAQLAAANIPGPLVPQLILRGAILDGTSQPVRFRVGQDNEWTEYWRGLSVPVSGGSEISVPPVSSGLADGS